MLRPYAATDAAAVSRCLTSGAAIDKTLLPIREEEWKSFVGRAFNRGARDFVVAENTVAEDTVAESVAVENTAAEDTAAENTVAENTVAEDTAAGGERKIVAVLMSTLLVRADEQVRSFRIIVHPDHRRQGIAKRLMAIVETQDVDHGTPLRAELPGDWTVGLALVKRHGFEKVDHDFFMRAAGDVCSTAATPDGFELRAYRPGDEDDAAWRRLNREAYEDTIGFVDLMTSEFESMRRGPLFSLWMATRDGEVVGLCHTNEFAEQGWINSIVVTKDCRSRGLGRALLARGIQFLRAARPEGRPDETWLNVRAENARAIALYGSMGFVRDRESYEWWKRRAKE